MKKVLLLSAVASTMIMAGGYIQPVTPVETPAMTPVVAETSGWDFSGNAKVYLQTDDNHGLGSLFDQGPSGDTNGSTLGDAGVSIKAENKDIFAGIGAGVRLNGLTSLGLEYDVVSNVMQSPNGGIEGGWISEGYLTYGIANTSVKFGRQELPKALSPFAYSEDWNVFANTFDALLVVNTDLPETALVGAWVYRNNSNGQSANMGSFTESNGKDNGIFMFTAQNKSVENLTLTGSVYYGSKFLTKNDLTIAWGDVAYAMGDYGVAVQGGTVMHDDFDKGDIRVVGGKVTANIEGFGLMGAYSKSNNGGLTARNIHGAFNVGGTTSALYTNSVANQLLGNEFEVDATKILGSLSYSIMGVNLAAVGAYSDATTTKKTIEMDFVVSGDVAENLNLMAAFVALNADIDLDAAAGTQDSHNVVRFVAGYNF